MSIFATNEAKAFWEARNDRARALAAARFTPLKGQTGEDDDSFRAQYADQLRRGSIHSGLLDLRSSLDSLLEEQTARFVFAKPESRLLMNTAGGVIENGGICLDRNSGVPYIPGSAVKGAARRHAIWMLSQENDPLIKAQIIARTSIIFGYGIQDWQEGRKTSAKHPHGGSARSDFWLSMVALENEGRDFDPQRDQVWNQVEPAARKEITRTLQLVEFPNQLSGCISFLPAFPEKDPGIDLDILTTHHPVYYKGEMPVATDDENPVPFVFPTIAAGTAFRFPLLRCQPFATDELENTAVNHLKEALQVFGLGAKTNAGYGWFSIDFAAQRRADQRQADALEKRMRDEHRASLNEEELIAEDLKELGPEEFARIIGNLENEEADKQKAACQMLQNSAKEKWAGWRRQKKGKWPDRIPKIREIAKQHNIDLP